MSKYVSPTTFKHRHKLSDETYNELVKDGSIKIAMVGGVGMVENAVIDNVAKAKSKKKTEQKRHSARKLKR